MARIKIVRESIKNIDSMMDCQYITTIIEYLQSIQNEVWYTNSITKPTLVFWYDDCNNIYSVEISYTRAPTKTEIRERNYETVDASMTDWK